MLIGKRKTNDKKIEFLPFMSPPPHSHTHTLLLGANPVLCNSNGGHFVSIQVNPTLLQQNVGLKKEAEVPRRILILLTGNSVAVQDVASTMTKQCSNRGFILLTTFQTD